MQSPNVYCLLFGCLLLSTYGLPHRTEEDRKREELERAREESGGGGARKGYYVDRRPSNAHARLVAVANIDRGHFDTSGIPSGLDNYQVIAEDKGMITILKDYVRERKHYLDDTVDYVRKTMFSR